MNLQLHYLQLACKILSFWQLDCIILVAYNRGQGIYLQESQATSWGYHCYIFLLEIHFASHPCIQQDIFTSTRYPFWGTVHPFSHEIAPCSLWHFILFMHELCKNLPHELPKKLCKITFPIIYNQTLQGWS